jgi:carbon monoxide dehydrogenase subunit G
MAARFALTPASRVVTGGTHDDTGIPRQPLSTRCVASLRSASVLQARWLLSSQSDARWYAPSRIAEIGWPARAHRPPSGERHAFTNRRQPQKSVSNVSFKTSLAALTAAVSIAFANFCAAESMPLVQQNDAEVSAATSIDGKLRAVEASIEIRASPERIWRVLTNCDDAVKFLPGVISCTIVQRAADDSWESVRHVVRYSWYVPRLTYVFRANLVRPSRVDFERTGGDLDSLKGSWDLRRDGTSTRVTYQAESQLGFWVPQWLVRIAVKRELPRMMRRLRDLSEPG